MQATEPDTDDGSTSERIQPLPTDGLEQYLLHGERQIQQLLTELINSHTLISVHILPGSESFLSAPVSLSADGLSLYLDVCIDENTNRRATLAAKLVCVAQLHHIRIQFATERATPALLDQRAALRTPLPTQMLRLQRRDSYRLHVPVSHDTNCVLPQPDDAPELAVRIIDIGAGGIAFHIAPEALSAQVGTKLQGCRLRLPELDPIEVTLEVRNVNPQRNRNGTESLRVGCRFVTLPRGADTAIQRYILQTEREINARERRGL